MKKKKLFSVAVAGMLVAAQVVMPASAATGSTAVTVSTKLPVVRVQVPTKLVVAVDEFEMTEKGTQIASEEYYIRNYSTIPVHVKAESTITAASTAALVAKKTDVVPNTTNAANGNAWLAVAAQVSAGKYIADSTKKIGDLTEASENVKTAVTSGTAVVQDFYLANGSGNVTYKMVKVGTDDLTAWPVSYAQFYELTEYTVADATDEAGSGKTFNGATKDADTVSAPAKTNTKILRELLAAGDVYAVKTSDIAIGVSVTKMTSAEAESATFDAAKTYYSLAAAATTSLVGTKNKIYVYAEHVTKGGETAFRFIGKLSEGKTNGWTSGDITSITIAYTITAVPVSDYEAKLPDCKYGLYTAPAAPSLLAGQGTTVTVLADTAVEIKLNLGAGTKKATAPKTMIWREKGSNIGADPNVSYANGTITINATAVNNLMKTDANFPLTLDITFDDVAKTVVSVTLNK